MNWVYAYAKTVIKETILPNAEEMIKIWGKKIFLLGLVQGVQLV